MSGCTIADVDHRRRRRPRTVHRPPGGGGHGQGPGPGPRARRPRRQQPRHPGRGGRRAPVRPPGRAASGVTVVRWSTPAGARCSPPPTGSTGDDRARTGRSRRRPRRPARADRARRAGGVAGRRLAAGAGRVHRSWATAPSATATCSASTPVARPRWAGRAVGPAARWPRPGWPADGWPRGAPRWPPVELVPDYRRPADARINWEQRAPADAVGSEQGPRRPGDRVAPDPSDRTPAGGHHRPHAHRGTCRASCGSRRPCSPSRGPAGCSSRSWPSGRPGPTGPPGSGAGSSGSPARCSSTTSPT